MGYRKKWVYKSIERRPAVCTPSGKVGQNVILSMYVSHA